jgi:hypothetical protein
MRANTRPSPAVWLHELKFSDDVLPLFEASSNSTIVSMAHTHKGDRLPLASKHIPNAASPAVTTLSRPPIGCEPAFSGVTDPKRSHIFGRCIS